MLKDLMTKERFYMQAKDLKKKRFKPGYDGMSMEGAASWLFINGDRLRKDILSGDYSPMPAIGFRTAKHDGSFRQLVRLTAIDLVLQTILNTCLSSLFEETFHDSSMAYRPGRGVHTALERYVSLAGEYSYAGKLDITACFDHIDHGILKSSLRTRLQDEAMIRLIMSFVTTPLSVDREIVIPERGLWQGMPLSPLLCNIYLHSLDMFLETNGIAFIRYADDLVLFGNSLAEINKSVERTAAFLEQSLRLSCNRKKCVVGAPVSMKYLGHRFTTDKKGVVAYHASSEPRGAYYNWHSEQPINSRGHVEILSDGILRQKDFSLFFDTETVDSTIPVVSTETVNIHSDVVFDTGFLSTVMRNGITVNVFDDNAVYIGSFIPNAPLKAPKVTHEQFMTYYDPNRRLNLAREFVLASIHNSLLNIRYHDKQESDPRYEDAINAMSQVKVKIKQEKEYESLLLLEAQARKIYYGCYDTFIKRAEFAFEFRSKRPPLNPFNAMLSYGNTVLYGLIATEIQKTPLDVRIGFLHATTARLNSLNLDIAEVFKPLLVDRVVLSLVNKGIISPEHFETCENGGIHLTAEGKRVFLRAFYDKLDTVITVKDRKMSYDGVIKEEIRTLVRHFRGEDKYRGFRQVR